MGIVGKAYDNYMNSTFHSILDIINNGMDESGMYPVAVPVQNEVEINIRSDFFYGGGVPINYRIGLGLSDEQIQNTGKKNRMFLKSFYFQLPHLSYENQANKPGIYAPKYTHYQSAYFEVYPQMIVYPSMDESSDNVKGVFMNDILSELIQNQFNNDGTLDILAPVVTMTIKWGETHLLEFRGVKFSTPQFLNFGMDRNFMTMKYDFVYYDCILNM